MADTAEAVLSAPNILEYPYSRSVGPVISRFLTGLRERRIEGIRATDGRVLVPPTEYDPETGDALTEFVEVGTAGVVTTWAWVTSPRVRGVRGRERRGGAARRQGNGDDLLRRERPLLRTEDRDPVRVGHHPPRRGRHRFDASHPGGRRDRRAHGHARRSRLVRPGRPQAHAREHPALPADG